jgi:hypothetical protein
MIPMRGEVPVSSDQTVQLWDVRDPHQRLVARR